jgi:SPP1 family predicted phage head-tail adaptor
VKEEVVRSGRLRKRLRLQRRAAGTDPEGTPTDDWTDVGGIWADVEPASGRERMMAAQAQIQLSHGVRIRYRPDVARAVPITGSGTGHHMRLLLNGNRVLDIHLIDDIDEAHRQLELVCVERQL